MLTSPHKQVNKTLMKYKNYSLNLYRKLSCLERKSRSRQMKCQDKQGPNVDNDFKNVENVMKYQEQQLLNTNYQ